MATKSFSAETKEALEKTDIKKKCCKRIYSGVAESLSSNSQQSKSLIDIYSKLKCENCLKEFIKAVFISCGTVTDPTKRYHLDFSFSDVETLDIMSEALANAGFPVVVTQRKNRKVIYFKDSDTISDLLAFMGAVTAAFEVMNSKIVKDVRNNANRLVNCDTANIEKAISASQKYLDAIEYIKASGGFTALPGELRQAANIRVDFPQASLSELASKCQPPITKSGMKHRLEKLLAHAEELKNRAENEK